MENGKIAVDLNVGQQALSTEDVRHRKSKESYR